MSNEDARAYGMHPAFAALEPTTIAAMAVDGAGSIVWTSPAGRALSQPGVIDEAAQRTLQRIAASGSEGLARIRLEACGDARPVTFRSRRVKFDDGRRCMLFEALAPLALQEPARDVAAEEGAHHAEVSAGISRTSEFETLDPRRELSTGEADAPAVAGIASSGTAAASADGSDDERSATAPDGGFVFEIDSDGRIAFLSEALGRLVGGSAAAAVGRSWREVSAELGLDPAKAIDAALDRRGGWSDIQISWPTDEGRRASFALSALPMFDRGRTFAGFRGLGRLTGCPTDAPAPETVGAHGEELPSGDSIEAVGDSDHASASTADAERTPTDAIAEGPARLSVVGAGSSASIQFGAPTAEAMRKTAAKAEADLEGEAGDGPFEPDPADREAGPTTAAATGSNATPEAAEPQAPSASRDEPPAIVSAPAVVENYPRKVVPLRDGGAARAAPRAALSVVEETAFDEIARRLRGLGAHVSEHPEPPPALAPETAEIRPTPEAADWTLDDVEGRAPTASRADDAFRLLDRLPLGALVLRAGEIAYANRATLEMAGHPDLKSLIENGSANLFADALPRDDAAPSTLRLRARDGIEIDVEARLSTISWRGAPATLVALKRAEAMSVAAADALQREREVSEILDTATDGVITIDSAGRILSVNRSAEALFGFDEASVIGSLFTLSLAPESRRAAYDYLDSLKSNGVGSVLNDGREVLGLARQGGAIPLYMTMGRIGAAQEGRYCAVLRDITHWKKAEEELLAAKRQAERANSQKSEFLARVSHEIRTPLNAIIGFSEVMMEERLGPVGNPRYKDYLRDIHVSGEHLTGLINDLLDLSKVESGLLKLEFASVDLNEIVSQAAALMQTQANRDHVIIRTSLARNLPHVLADRRSARQIMANLVSNAVKFSRPGGQVIVATAYTDGGQAVVRVRDAGVGMSKKDISRALEPFRALPSAEGDSGSGIGLPLTKALIEANEASFGIQSEIGEGTLVEVTFPAARVLAG